jgi:Lrp/AsnC family transcriptional regulator, regulator for asnA, asnC and gidA
MSLDALDEKLIGVLKENARQSSEKLAKKLNVSPTTVRRRLKKLIRSQSVRMVALVEPSKAGISLLTIIAFDVAHDSLDESIQLLMEQSEVKWISTTTGRFDILVEAAFHSTQELSDFLQKKLAGLKGLKDTETFVCLEVKKGKYISL